MRHGVWLSLENPEWSRVSCEECETYLLNPDGTRMTKFKDGKGKIRIPVLRPKGSPTPCHKCPKIPHNVEKVRQNAIDLSNKNVLAYAHYLRCRAVGRFPDDPLVMLHAAVIRSIYDQWERYEQLTILTSVRSKVQ